MSAHTATAIRQRYIGPDVNGKEIAGLILHVGHYGKGSQPVDYVILTDANGNGRCGTALAPAAVVHEHLAGLVLLRSMEADSE